MRILCVYVYMCMCTTQNTVKSVQALSSIPNAHDYLMISFFFLFYSLLIFRVFLIFIMILRDFFISNVRLKTTTTNLWHNAFGLDWAALNLDPETFILLGVIFITIIILILCDICLVDLAQWYTLNTVSF